MSDKELEEYIKEIDAKFESHIEKGTIEMTQEYYNLVEERMARLINENQQLKEALDRKNYFKYRNKTYDGKIVLKQIDLYKSVIEKVSRLVNRALKEDLDDLLADLEKAKIILDKAKENK